jgi:ethanolamine transporter EutH
VAATVADAAPLWASWVHPIVATVGLTLAMLAVQRGLTIRQTRTRRQPASPDAMTAHLAFARPAVITLLLAFGMGLASAVLVRGFTPFASTHSSFASVATAAFAVTGILGRGMVKDRAKRRALHVAAGVLGLGAGALTALTGLPMLP